MLQVLSNNLNDQIRICRNIVLLPTAFLVVETNSTSVIPGPTAFLNRYIRVGLRTLLDEPIT